MRLVVDQLGRTAGMLPASHHFLHAAPKGRGRSRRKRAQPLAWPDGSSAGCWHIPAVISAGIESLAIRDWVKRSAVIDERPRR